MADIKDKKDSTEWPDLKEKAKGGKITLHPGAIEKCVKACVDLVDHMTVYNRVIDDRKLTSIEQFSNEPGGVKLAGVFNEKGIGVQENLRSYSVILQNLADTFVEAGKAYMRADNKSAEEIGNVTKPAPDPNSAPAPIGNRPGLSGNSDVPKGLGGDGSGKIEIDVKPSDSYTDAMARDFVISIGGKAEKAADAAYAYKYLRENLGAELGNFKAGIKSIPSDDWGGEGRDASIGAVNRIVAHVESFTDELHRMEENLDYVSRCLHATFLNTEDADEYDGDDHDSNDMEDFRKYYDEDYKAGIQNAGHYMPMVNVFGPPPPPPSDGGSAGGGGNGGNGSNGGGDGNKGNNGSGDHGDKSDDCNDGSGNATSAGGPGSGGDHGAKGDSGGDSMGHTAPPPLPSGSSTSPTPPQDPPASRPHSGKPEVSPPAPPSSTPPSSDPNSSPVTPPPATGANSANGVAPLMSAINQGIQAASSAVNGMVTAGTQVAKMAEEGKIPGIPGPPEPGNGAGRGGGGGAAGIPAPPNPLDPARLFPRASIPFGPDMPGGASPAVPSGSGVPMGGTPGPSAPPGAGAQGQPAGAGHRRAKYLDSPLHLEQALGKTMDSVRPVIEPEVEP